MWHSNIAQTHRLVFALLAMLPAASIALAERAGISELDVAAAKAGRPTYELRYKFRKGEVVRFRVAHLVTMNTKVGDEFQRAKTGSVATKVWKVTAVDADGNFTFTHLVNDVDMWNQLTGSEETRYNSKTDHQAPLGYESIAERIGVPLTHATVSPHGEILKRQDVQQSLGFGRHLVFQVPREKVGEGDAWFFERDLIIDLPGVARKRVKTRDKYRLEEVKENVARISVKTQVLTPVNDPKVRAKLIQRLFDGEIKFDLGKGRVIHQQLDVDESVYGFHNAESSMEYLSRFRETLLETREKSSR